MATCASCNAEIEAGIRWCGICHANVIQPTVGRLASPGKRLGAYFLDATIPLVAFFLMFVVASWGSAASEGGGGGVVGLLLLFLLGFLWILIDRDNQGWHDKLVSTYVVG